MRRIALTAVLSATAFLSTVPLATPAVAQTASPAPSATEPAQWLGQTTATRTRGTGLQSKVRRLRTATRPPATTSPTPPPTASPTPAPTTPAPATEAPVVTGRATSAPQGLDVTTVGAVGDGVTDDTAALQRALDGLAPGSTLILPAGRVFAHSDLVRVRVPGTTVTGGGTLLATHEARSSVWLEADDVLLQDVVVRVASTTRRWDAYEQMGVRVAARGGVVVRRIGVYGAAAAGIYVGGAWGFTIDDVIVSGSRSDGIHMTEGSKDGQVSNARVSGAGDDGIAVVSYARDGAPCARISVADSSVKGGSWGRAFSVVGGEDVSYSRITAEASNAAALYFSTEGAPYYTASTRRVTVQGATLLRSNSNAAVDHGAVMMWNGNSGTEITDVALRNVTVTDTRATAHRHIGVITEGGLVARIEMSGIAITGGPQNALVSNAPQGAVVRAAWTQDGRVLVP